MIRSGFSKPLRFAPALLVLVLLVVAGEAKATPPGGGAGGSTASGSRPAATAPSAADASEEASSHFKRGLQLFDEGDYTLALVEFERAYQLAPNYRALYNIALVNMQLGRYADAARTFEKYLHDGGEGISAARLAEVKKTLGELKFRTATVDITTNMTSAEVILDGKPLDPSSLHGPMVIDAGEHTLRATAPGFQALNRTVTLAGGDRASVRMYLLAVIPSHTAETPVHVHAVFWPGFLATGALAAGALVSVAILVDARSHLSMLQNTPSDPGSASADAAQRASTASRANTAAIAADVLSGLAVVAGGVSLYLSLGPDHAPKSASVAISPQRVSLSVPF